MPLTKSLFTRPLIAGIGLIMAGSMFLAPLSYAQSSGGAQRDCDDNAILRCGAYSSQEMNEKYNSQADAKSVFKVFGINETHMSQLHSTAVNGHVTKGGRVLVNGEAVANGAMTVGRQNMPGSEAMKLGNQTYYMRPPSASFNQDKLDAYVVMNGGKFQYAIIKSCGNPVRATPVEKPQPAPQPVQPAASSGECKLINVTTGPNRQVSVTVNSATVNAQVTGYTIDFGDGTPAVNVAPGNSGTQGTTTGNQNNANTTSSTSGTNSPVSGSSGSSSSGGGPSLGGPGGNTPNTNVPNSQLNNSGSTSNSTNTSGSSGTSGSNSTSNSTNTTNSVNTANTNQTVSNTSQPVTHTYAKDGSFTITATVQVRHPDGRSETKASETCKIPVNFAAPAPAAPAAKAETPPPAPQPPLPAAGAGEVAGVATAVGLASMFGYFFYGWLRSRLNLL